MRDTAGVGPIPAGSGNDAHAVLDLALRATLGRGFALTGRVDNLADEAYVAARRPFGARPGKPRSVHLGLEYRFD